ncbi:unnamed protein product [Lactuca virosa]|uniref:Phytocyanin domain-containing protein n=1 Tax=Lactuca virosa TaxID=75947 RepID=A0AAU9LIU2_9ASTR|nr:unnamed protein product [Lactuca virosa]
MLVVFMEFNHSVATEHVVGDSFGWAVPQNDGLYVMWSLNHTFKIDDTLVFNFVNGFHNVAEVTKKAYDNCDIQNLISIQTTSPARFTVNNIDNHYYICTIRLHCKSFLKLAIRVSVPNISSAMLSH